MRARREKLPSQGRRKLAARPWHWYVGGFLSALALILAGTLWMAGTVYSELPKPAKLESLHPVDVIVCLTGGRGRIQKALELYRKGYGRRLYISGIDRQVQMKEILKEIRMLAPVDENRVVLENVATNTIENAEQVRQYLEAHHYRSVLLVTSVYHVRRAYYLFQKVLPREVQLEVTWYEREPFAEADWWKSWNGIIVTVSEFFKFYYDYLKISY